MKTTKFISAQSTQRKGSSEKSTFQRSHFNNGMEFTVLRSDYVVSEDRKDDADATASPVLVLALNGIEFQDKLFISTLVRDDLNIDFDLVPKSGTFNVLAKNIWNRADLLTDDSCLAELINQLAGRKIRVRRCSVPVDPTKPDGPKHKVEQFGNARTLNQLNFDIV